MSARSGDPSIHPVIPSQIPPEAPPRFDKKPFDGIHSIRKWIVVFGVVNSLAVATAQTISLIVNSDDTKKIGPVTVQLLVLNIILIVCMILSMRRHKRRSVPFGPLVGRAYILRIVVAVVAVGVMFIYAVVPIDIITSNFRRKADAPSLATSSDLLEGAAISILYVTSGLQVILAILLAMEQHMEIKLRRDGPALTPSESQPQHLYVYQPAIPLRSDFSRGPRTTRTHYVGEEEEEDLANKDALPAYERQRPDDHPAVHIIDMTGPAHFIQGPQEPSIISPPDYDNADVAASETSHASTAVPVAIESEVRPQGHP
ncbi:unnamed protein product [Mortierella alpina]